MVLVWMLQPIYPVSEMITNRYTDVLSRPGTTRPETGHSERLMRDTSHTKVNILYSLEEAMRAGKPQTFPLRDTSTGSTCRTGEVQFR